MSHIRIGTLLVVFTSLLAGWSAGLRAEPQPAITTINIEGMHCPSCAKRIATALKEVPGVASAQADAEKGLAVVQPRGPKAPSPRAQWEAIEKLGFKPVRLACPYGVFTSKPRF
jgi:copper chaperone CopZ